MRTHVCDQTLAIKLLRSNSCDQTLATVRLWTGNFSFGLFAGGARILGGRTRVLNPEPSTFKSHLATRRRDSAKAVSYLCPNGHFRNHTYFRNDFRPPPDRSSEPPAMNPDDEVCLCFHVSLRKIANFMARERPRVPSQISECLGAGTGCQWCVPFLKKLHRLHVEGLPVDLPVSPEEYAKRRARYRRSGERDGSTEETSLNTPESPPRPESDDARRESPENRNTRES